MLPFFFVRYVLICRLLQGSVGQATLLLFFTPFFYVLPYFFVPSSSLSLSLLFEFLYALARVAHLLFAITLATTLTTPPVSFMYHYLEPGFRFDILVSFPCKSFSRKEPYFIGRILCRRFLFSSTSLLFLISGLVRTARLEFRR